MSEQEHTNIRLGLAISAVVLGLFLCAVNARASDLPGGVTCEQIVRYAEDLHIPNNALGRVQARIIALTFGIVVTGKQLDAAAKCLRQYQADRDYGCSAKQQAPNGECK